MTGHFLDIIRREAGRVADRIQTGRLGVITSYDPDHYAVKVELQPEGTETGWLPLGTLWSGNGWGMFCAPNIGDQVEVELHEGGGATGSGHAGLRLFSSAQPPVSVPAGGFLLQHVSGSLLQFKNDGSVSLVAAAKVTGQASAWELTGNMHLTGDLTVSGQISDREGAGGTVQHIRDQYNSHIHTDSRGGRTSPPDAGL